ncbi:HI0933 family protein [Sphaerochaeta globosa str. Buddy]|uniref:HI0933 family protein n=2 Tax=Sphaerochaeta TaxID=399320 RepID=F0RYL4_SPHGB|nr:HI0933 family protein [Sphaerochaeta globosa str. Buddy]
MTLLEQGRYNTDMQIDINLRLSPQEAADTSVLTQAAAKQAGIPVRDIGNVRILRRSIDARRRPVVVDLQIRLSSSGEDVPFEEVTYQNVGEAKSVIVVGAGPAGLFASLRLLELGLKPVLLERGLDVHQRKKDLAGLVRTGIVDTESNYSFGEGGAGAFSDGKLYTRATKRGDVSKVLNQLCQHGADLDILCDAHPHIGSNKLPQVIEAIRNTILSHGGEIHFQSKVVALLRKGFTVEGVQTSDGATYFGPVILATGHSARDMYRYLHAEGIAVESKAMAMGVRLEHKQHLIDQMQYKQEEGRGLYLPAAEYSFVHQVEGRGVYSFCMCPGGFVIPAATEAGQQVVNGMSASDRKGEFANSGMVVELHPEDLPSDKFSGPLAMLEFQEALERRSFAYANQSIKAPAQRMVDFVKHVRSKDLCETSYLPGLVNADLHALFPAFISTRLALAFEAFGKKASRFLTNDALLLAAETRTSSPVRIPRDTESKMHPEYTGLFPCGEGAGYAGGIVSAAMDGVSSADGVKAYLGC